MLSVDPELRLGFTAFEDGTKGLPRLPRGDWQNRRKAAEAAASFFEAAVPAVDTVDEHDFEVASADGTPIHLRWYRRRDSVSRAAVLYIHGGGKIGGSVSGYNSICRLYADRADVGVLAVDFRLSPEHPFPAPNDDGYAGLVWLADHAGELGVDLGRIAVAGDSGGGGIAAGIVHMARDRGGPSVAKQMLIYPMMDDRNTVEDPLLAPFAIWSYDDNYTGWHSFVGDQIGTDDVSPYAAPSRETDYSGLPPTFIDVGELDIFRDESVAYATQLLHAGVSAELHVYPGAPHGFEFMAPGSDMARNAWAARIRFLRNLNVEDL